MVGRTQGPLSRGLPVRRCRIRACFAAVDDHGSLAAVLGLAHKETVLPIALSKTSYDATLVLYASGTSCELHDVGDYSVERVAAVTKVP